MTRHPRIEYPGAIHHVTQRGNDRQLIFETPDDYRVFLDTLGECVERYGWQVFTYCLMPNHVHLVIRTPEPNLSRGMRKLTGSYARKFNASRNRTGHVFQRRFGSRVLEREGHFEAAMAYVALNPVRAGMVSRPENWIWGAHGELTGTRRRTSLIAPEVFEHFASRAATARARYGRMVQRMEETADDVALVEADDVSFAVGSAPAGSC